MEEERSLSEALAQPAWREAFPGGLARGRQVVRTVRRFGQRKPLGLIAAVALVGLILLGALAPLLTPYDPTLMSAVDRMSPPTGRHLLGTDQFGRDLLSRLVMGTRVSMALGLATAFLGVTVGGVLGIVSGYVGGKLDLWLQRVLDVIMAFPTLILAMAIVAALGGGLFNVVLAIAIPMTPKAARVVRSSVLSIKAMTFVDGARAIGCSSLRVMARHIAPNVVAPYLIILTAMLSVAILTEASLSYLGLGTQEPNASWGLMLAGTAAYYAEAAPWIPIFPGLALTVTVLAFNFLGDAIRDVLDPRLRT